MAWRPRSDAAVSNADVDRALWIFDKSSLSKGPITHLPDEFGHVALDDRRVRDFLGEVFGWPVDGARP